MTRGALAIVECWQNAVNDGCLERVRAFSADRVHVTGPRGTGTIESSELGSWMIRSGFSGTPLRWFCGANGTVVVEQAARWKDPSTGVEVSRSMVSTHFRVTDDRVIAVHRHAELAQALDDAGLFLSDRVLARA